MITDKRIVIGADPLAVPLKDKIKEYLITEGYQVKDIGSTHECDVDYYLVGEKVGKLISQGEYARGVILCGSGMGVNIVANKYKGVYCGLCESRTTATMCRTINNCNVLAMGALIVSEFEAIEMVKTFLSTPFAVNFPLADETFLRDAVESIKDIEKDLFV